MDEGEIEEKTLCVKNLTKSIGRKHIIRNLNFSLKRNQCFGLLGVNGAGKSTTFRVLTKFLSLEEGNVSIEDVSIDNEKYSQKIGYCPQEDCLNFSLTGRELLRVMARLKECENPSKTVEFLLEKFGLEDYADKPCLEYSGGNKRKLCTCIAFLGSPTAILLDEPTSGVDPASRRMFWEILQSFKKNQNASVLLCSHSMEECENLCDKIAIMKNGQIQCEDTLLQLKRKYQKGYKVSLQLSNADLVEKIRCQFEEEHKDVVDGVHDVIDAKLIEEHEDLLTYQVKTDKKLSELFKTLENLKAANDKDIKDYSISQMSLEDVFLLIAGESNNNCVQN